MEFKGKKWYDDMVELVNEYLEQYDNDIDTVAQVIENSPYVISTQSGDRLIYEISQDIHYAEILDNARIYGVIEEDDDVALVNAIFLRVAEEIMSELE